MTMRGASRPNVLPANFKSKGEYVDEMAAMNVFTKDFKSRRKTIGDLCDFCIKEIRVSRNGLAMRKYGWRLCCENCRDKNKFDLKKDKIWIEFRFPKKAIFP